MGLAAAKNKRKLGNDPNNTKWSRNTDSFGQKILRSQGWQPGDYLGAKDAPHAEWHTEANTSHIRVVLKDDTLGLGAKRNNGDECTGLDAFQHLLGRLNGKSDETLEAEQKVREDVKLSLYMERKFGTIRFVKGGWLVGDQVKETPDEAVKEAQKGSTKEAQKDSADASDDPEPAAVKPKKRKADQDTDREDDKARKKEKKSKKRKTDAEAEVDSEGGKKKKDKKSKRRRTESEEGDEKSAAAPETSESPDEIDSSSEAKRVKKEKKEKKKDKKDKKEKKEKRRKDKEASESGAETGDSISKERKRRKKDATAETLSSAPTPAESSMSTPSGSGYSTPVPTSSRYLARSRFIAQKKLAFADSAALNQIFMIKS